MKKTVLNLKNKSVGDIDLDAKIFGIKILPDLIHQYIRYQNAKSRQGSHKTKSRSEVSGRSKKPFSQKGTGNARQGRFDNETKGDNFYPSLVGITKTKKWSAVDSYKKVLKIHSINKINLDLDINDYKNMMIYFKQYDEKLFKENLIICDW